MVWPCSAFLSWCIIEFLFSLPGLILDSGDFSLFLLYATVISYLSLSSPYRYALLWSLTFIVTSLPRFLSRSSFSDNLLVYITPHLLDIYTCNPYTNHEMMYYVVFSLC